MIKNILKTATAIFFTIFTISSCQENFDKKTYEVQKQTIAQKEENNPLEFLKVKGDDKKKFLGATVIKGIITNTATVCPYSNVRIKLLSFKNGVSVEEHEDVVKGILKPGEEMDFKIKYHLPKGADSLALSILSAHPITNSMVR